MDPRLLIAITVGPLAALGAYQLLGVRKLVSWDSAKTAFWGAVYALLVMPALALATLVPVEPIDVMFREHGARLLRIWAIVFGLAVAARIGSMLARWLWRKRPRATA